MKRFVCKGGLTLTARVAMTLTPSACIPDLPGDRPVHDSSSVCGNAVVDLGAGEQCDPGPNAGDTGAALCSETCRMVCRGGYIWPTNNHCYWRVRDTSALAPEALNACGPGHVATFGSEDEFNAVTSSLEGDSGLFWVGMTTEAARSYVAVVDYEPGWQTTCTGCYARTSDAAAPLAKFIGPNGALNEPCVVASFDPSDPDFRQSPCTGVRTHVVCEREPLGSPSSPCGDGGACFDLVATYGTKHYVYHGASDTADGAAAHCTSTGGWLVVLRSRDEREQLWFALSRVPSPPQRIWIGLEWGQGATSDGGGARAGAWVWADGRSADVYPPVWGDRQPSDAGVTSRAYLRAFAREIDNTLAHNDERLTGTLPYVCELPNPGIALAGIQRGPRTVHVGAQD